MATATAFVPLETYLATSYRPDRDWIDGELRERNMGEGPHAEIQGFLIAYLRLRAKDWAIRVTPEHRLQTSERHYRIPDVAIARADAPFERILRTPPLCCVEILSYGDRMSEMLERVEDYLAMGVTAAWIIDPQHRRAFQVDSDGVRQVPDHLSVNGTPITVSLAEMFAELNELEGRAKPLTQE